jgi:hypothetical protein
MININRAKTEFENHTKETLDVQSLGGALYAFGSELACLRLAKAYRHCGERADYGFSQNLKTWYFRLETL